MVQRKVGRGGAGESEDGASYPASTGEVLGAACGRESEQPSNRERWGARDYSSERWISSMRLLKMDGIFENGAPAGSSPAGAAAQCQSAVNFTTLACTSFSYTPPLVFSPKSSRKSEKSPSWTSPLHTGRGLGAPAALALPSKGGDGQHGADDGTALHPASPADTPRRRRRDTSLGPGSPHGHQEVNGNGRDSSRRPCLCSSGLAVWSRKGQGRRGVM